MNFLKDKVQKYQEKKLLEAKEKLQFHKETKNQLERQLKNIGVAESYEIKKEITKHKEFIEIWDKNIDSIKKQLKKIKS